MKTEKRVIILGAVLFISLSANLFMAGLMLGRSFSQHHERAAMAGVNDENNHADWKKRDEALRKKLSMSDRQILRETMKANRAEFMGLREKLAATQKEVEAAMNAKPFDRAALDTAMEAEKQAKMNMLDKMRGVREEIMKKISPEARDVLFKNGPFKHIDASRLEPHKRRFNENGRQNMRAHRENPPVENDTDAPPPPAQAGDMASPPTTP